MGVLGAIILFLLIKKFVIKPLEKYFEEQKELKLAEERAKKYLEEASKQNIKHTFRPETFDEYIGQRKAKRILQNYIKAVKERNKIMPHILLYGKAGMGKTTLARIIANELQVNIVEVITSNIVDIYQIFEYLEQADGGILFLDEIHAITRDNAEKLYSLMEDFMYNGRYVKPFTLIGATTEVGEIIRTKRPFYDRFKIIIELEEYTKEDLIQIAKQYQERVFKEELEEEIYEILANNCRNTPRTLIRLLEATNYFDKNINEVLESFGIIKDGFTYKDLTILKYIAQNEKGVGLQGLISYLDTSRDNYLYEIEPFLLKNGCIIRTPRGRKITQKGLEIIRMLEEKGGDK